ncbi:MAG: MBL fold metallo-hydrolase [Clostridiales bacterium]|nr:MBL fold metallo-hydrolase [Clostridiales bacterium]
MDSIICPAKYRTITRENIVERIQVNDWLYILDEVNSAIMYLIVGSKGALLFDTGYGFVGFKHLITEVTDLPITVVCSHGHDDHVLGNYEFGEVYIAKADYALCISNDNPEQKEKQILSRRIKTPNIDDLVDREEYFNRTKMEGCQFRFTQDDDIFDLGGITLKVFSVPGHTPGSIALYTPEKKALFSGDFMMKNHKLVYAQGIEISAPPQDFIRGLGRLEKLDVETVWPAHGDAPAGPELITDTRAMLIEWAHQGDPEKDEAPKPKGNVVFGDPKRKPHIYRYKDLEMNYNVDHLWQIRDYMAQHDGAVE